MTDAHNDAPVSRHLEELVRSEVRQQGIVIWLDRDAHYTRFVDALATRRAAGDLPYDVVAWRGSHLALMFAVETLAGGVDKPLLLVHLPGFNEDAVKKTPLFELYAPGARWRKALDTLLGEAAAGRVLPARTAAFVEQPGLTLEKADAWLADELALVDGGLAALLRGMALPAVVDDLLAGGHVATRLEAPEDQVALWHHLAVQTGLPPAWRDAVLPAGGARASEVAFAVASWALGVEYVHDLRRPPWSACLEPTRTLPSALVATCRGLADYLRKQHAAFYQRTAEETEDWLAEEVARAAAEDLGKVDTFRFEEETILDAAFDALAGGRFDAAFEWALPRVDGAASFWIGIEPARRSAWTLVADAARMGQAMVAAGTGLGRIETLDEALEVYVAKGAAVDLAHRRLEQRRTALLYTGLPWFERLRTELDAMRGRWRRWADAWARELSALYRQAGFLPSASLQQRVLFDDVVRPLTQEEGTTALFVVDALRYEMALELYDGLKDAPATTAQLRARWAELPTVTEVGMNALAPVASGGRLRAVVAAGPQLVGFQMGEYQVRTPETRQRAMQERVGGATCPWLTLEDVVARDASRLKQSIGRARLVVVHSTEIDDAGENGAGTAVFDVVMQKLRAAWRLLREAGVRRFVFTADHGFLLLDETVRNVQTHGRKVDAHRRHALSTVAADHAGEVRVALAELGYEGADGVHLMLPETTALFDTGGRAASFAHGGASFEERVIPVLTVVHRAATGSDRLRYAVRAEAREGVAGMHCVEATVEVAAQDVLDFGGRREVELLLRAVDVPGVTVELCQTRRGARIEGGTVRAAVGSPFEVFFRLVAASEARARVEVFGPTTGAAVAAATVDGRFLVVARAGGETATRAPEPTGWLEELPEDGTRQLFEHVSRHGAVSESEAMAMLGGPAKLRRFSVRFEEYAKKVPFGVRIDVVAGVKRYVRE